jgi:hypothetical protein
MEEEAAHDVETMRQPEQAPIPQADVLLRAIL